ncbi:MAG: hypothetical protein JNK63_08605 [Chthonomonas sp.]|nr:hypothetical protein [Chthonomonas sp.]
MTLLLQRLLCLTVFAICLVGDAQAQVIATLGLTQHVTAKYSDPECTVIVEELSASHKLVILAKNSEYVTVLNTDGAELYVPTFAVVFREKVTLKQALEKVDYFERERQRYPDRGTYFDIQAGPWVALVARHLGSQKDAGTLPDVTGTRARDYVAPKLTVKNSTQYSLRVYLVGPTTVTRTIRAGASLGERFPAGSYRAVVQALSGSVRPLKTTWKLDTGYEHQITLVIKTVRVPR